ncbi:MAG TPA: DUF5979 domain-containing protein [Galbitalea sp.]
MIGRKSLRAFVAAAASIIVIASVATPAVAFADGGDVPTIHLSKTVSPAPPTALHPGDTATYTLNVECSSLDSQCDGFAVTDTIPAPLVLGAVSSPSGIKSTVAKSGNTFTVTFTQPLEDGSTGLDAGHQVGFTVSATVPTGVSADWDGKTVTNTATATATNVPDPVTSSADVLIAVPKSYAASIANTFSPSTLTSAPGKTSTIALAVGNSSNTAVDTMTVQDPATVPSTSFQYVGITGVTVPHWPGGANQVRVDWWDGAAWNTGTFASAAALPSGVPASGILGLRFVFRNSAGTIATGGTGEVDIQTALRSNVTGITSNTTVANAASSFVTSGATNSTTVSSSANLAITHVTINPTATETYDKASILGGVADRATIVGTNGGQYTITKLAVTDPAAGDPTLADQGISFTGWDNANIEWPVGATAGTIEYLYSDGAGSYASSQAIAKGSPIPVADPAKTVIGFRATFIGTMLPGQYATLPFTFGTSAVTADQTVTNTIAVDVTTDDSQTAEALAHADLTLRTARINTSVSKSLTPSKLYSVAGAHTVVSLPARIDAQPTAAGDTGGSTVGADSLTVNDEATPGPNGFWDDFDASSIVATDVPNNVSMTVNYWDASSSAWVPLVGATGIVGRQSFSYTLTSGQSAAADGLQFVYTPTSGTLAPGFSVQPNIRATLRSALRSDPSTAPNASTTDTVTVQNTVGSIATSASTTPSTVTASGSASLMLLPVDPGAGLDLITKTWKKGTGGIALVQARTGQSATAILDWGTASLGFHSVVISDSENQSPSLGTVAGTAYDEFNLISIPAITPAMDPLLTYDAVQSVQLYIPGSGWIPTATNPCAANACDGTFPGYTLSATESANAIGVRLVYVESPTRALRTGGNPSAPEVGDGVAASTDKSRELDLVFALRDTRRSDPSAAVLGTTAGTVYNVADEPGVVNNGARLDGRDATDVVTQTSTSSDDIQIMDQPVNVTVSKSWGDGAAGNQLGVPPTGTDPAFYPTATVAITATNTSLGAVDQLSIADPTESTNPFDYLDITKIDSITVPAGTTSTTIQLAPASQYPTSYTVAQAVALTSSTLANATGITITYNGRIAAGKSAVATFETRLRPSVRGSGDPVLGAGVDSMTVDNTTTATITDPEVLTNPSHTTSADSTASVVVAKYTYGVTAGKIIAADTTSGATPAIQYDGSAAAPKLTLSGQPTGNVPTTRMVFDDETPSFWNAYDFSGFGSLAFAAPINRAEVDALVGVTYDTYGGGIQPLCAGSADLTNCWVNGTAKTTLSLPTGVSASAVRGLRFTFTKSDYSTWERPHNPLQSVSFTVARRSTYVAPAGTAVPSNLYTNTTLAPGETQLGVFTNTVLVTDAAAASAADTNPVWSSTQLASAQITYQHLPARVKIVKSPAGNWPLGTDIPYTIAVTNTGSGHDKQLSGVVVTDTLPGDSANGPDLVLPADPDTGLPETAAQAFSYSLTSGGTTTTPDVTPVLGTVNSDGTRVITFTLNGSQVIPFGATLTITATLDFRQGLDAFTPVTNTATVTSDQVFDTCDWTRNTAAQPQQVDVASCSSDTTTFPQPSAPLTIVKGVRGDGAGPLDADGTPSVDGDGNPYDDMGVVKTVASLNSCTTTNPVLAKDAGKGFYSYPCVPITRPGGSEEWESQFTNGGNIALGKIVAIDVLPRVNDQGVIIASSRGSKWAPTLTSYPVLHNLPNGATYSVYYTDQTSLAGADCNGADIQSTMGMTATSTPAVLSDYQSCLTDLPGSDHVPDRTWQLLSPSASAAILGTAVALKFVVDMGDGLAPGASIDITYESRTADNIGLAEAAVSLGRDSIAYNSIAGAAIGRYTDSGDEQDLPYPFVSEPRKVGIAMATGSLTLLKTVTGAAASTVAPATNTLFLQCTSNGTPVHLVDNTGAPITSFTVSPGIPLPVQGIPLYSKCAVTEPTNYGQTSKTIVPSTLTAEAALTPQSAEIDNPHPAFDTSRPAIQQTTVTNDYDLSDFTVTKTVNTNGALDQAGNPITYAAASFSVTCTFANGAGTVTTLPATSFMLSNGQSKAFSSIPAGSSCLVTETNTQKASTSTYTLTSNGTTVPSTGGVFTVAPSAGGATPTNVVAFTNTYTTGSLEIDKTVVGAWGAARTFAFGVVCKYTNGSSPAVTSTVYNGTFSLASPSPVTASPLVKTISNLPTGAICTLTESGKAGATTTAITGNAATIGAGTTKKIAVTNTYSLATLTVKKLVHTSAIDAAGNPDLPNFSFPMAVACTFQGADVWGTGFSASPMTFGLTQGTSRAIAGLPAGAVCQVTETDAHGADSTTIDVVSNAASSSVAATTASLTLTADGLPIANSATVNNNYGVTSFTVTKALAGAGAAQFAAASFDIHVTCSSPGIASSYDKVITLPTGGAWTKTINNLPVNSFCSAVEAGSRATTGADTQSFVDSDGSTTGIGVAATAATPGSVTITNWYLTGALTVTKSVVGGGGVDYGSATSQFTIALECTRDDTLGNLVDVTIPGGSSRTITGGQSTTFTHLPSGAVCKLRETDAGGATSSAIRDADDTVVQADATTAYTIAPISINTATLTDDQTQPPLTVENTFDLASLAVTKRVDSAAVDQDGVAISYGPFPVAVTCTFPTAATTVFDSTKDLVKDDSWVIPNLPAGAQCAVTETDAKSAVGTSIETVAGGDDSVLPGTTTASMTLVRDSGGTANTADLTNSYEAGDIQLAKIVSGNGAADWGNSPFTLGVTCVLTDGSGTRTVFDKEYTVHRGDAPIEIEDVATGADCTVTESKTGGANSTTIALDGGTAVGETSADFTSPAPGPAYDVDVTNEFDEASVDITKNRDGTGAGLWDVGPFVAHLVCSRDIDGVATDVPVTHGGDVTLDATHSYLASYTGLPADATCDVTETKTGGASSTTITPSHFTTDTAVASDVQITNTFDTGSLTVTKTITGAGAALWGAGPFDVSIACQRPIDGAMVAFDVPGGAVRELNSGNGYVATWTLLPDGAVCVPTETIKNGASLSTFDQSSVTIAGNATAQLGLTNEFDIGQLVVHNVVRGGDARHHHADIFTEVLTCTLDIDGVPTIIDIPGGGSRRIGDGATIVYDDLPMGAMCTLVETVNHNAQVVTITWKGQPVPANQVMVGDPDFTVHVVNVFNVAGGLAFTGENLGGILWLAIIGVLVGAVLMILQRRRRRGEA